MSRVFFKHSNLILTLLLKIRAAFKTDASCRGQFHQLKAHVSPTSFYHLKDLMWLFRIPYSKKRGIGTSRGWTQPKVDMEDTTLPTQAMDVWNALQPWVICTRLVMQELGKTQALLEWHLEASGWAPLGIWFTHEQLNWSAAAGDELSSRSTCFHLSAAEGVLQ